MLRYGMAKKKYLCRLEELVDNQLNVKQIDSREFLVLRRGDSVFACGNQCTHQGARLSDGSVHENSVTCPAHHARFNLKSGTMEAPPALDDIPSYEVSVSEGEVYIGRPRPAVMPNVQIDHDGRVVVIGTGPAGAVCAETLRKEGYSGHIDMITSEEVGPYDRTLLSKEYLARTAEPDWLPLRDEELYEAFGISLHKNTEIVSVDRENKRCTSRNGDQFEYDYLVAAPGSVARTLMVQGHDLRGIYTLRSKHDADQLLEAIDEAESILIIGAGFVGLECAAVCREHAKKTSVVAMEETPFESFLGAEIGNRIIDVHRDHGVRFHLGRRVERFLGTEATARSDEEQTIRAVELDDGRVLDADLVLVAAGAKPRIELLEQCGLECLDDRIAVDQELRTSDESIFAAGDIAAAPYPFVDGLHSHEHWTQAMRQGRHIARIIAGTAQGDEAVYCDVPFFWTSWFDTKLKSVGIPRVSDSSYIAESSDEKILIVYKAGDKIVGAAGFSVDAELMDIEHALRTGADPNNAL